MHKDCLIADKLGELQRMDLHKQKDKAIHYLKDKIINLLLKSSGK